MREATIERIKKVYEHPNADKLELVKVLGYQCVVPKGAYKEGDLIVYIKPDTVLPELEWAETYRQYAPKRVKAVKLRGEWSEGIVAPLTILNGKLSDSYGRGTVVGGWLTYGVGPEEPDGELTLVESTDVTEILGVEHYEPPVPNDLNASGGLPFGIPTTNEDRHESLDDNLPFGEAVDVTLKVDGQSCSFYYKVDEDEFGILGRRFKYREEYVNPYTVNAERLGIKEKLIAYCKEHNVSLCIRGEQYGNGIQKGGHNPHASQNLGWKMFSVYLIDEHEYANKGHQFYYKNVAESMQIDTVPTIEEDAILTKELVQKYSSELKKLNGVNFEGVVVKHSKGSFKIINKHYDALK